MIQIYESIYKKLIGLDVQETCGIIAGRGSDFSHFFRTKNKSKFINEFHIGMVEKVKVAWKMFRARCDVYCLFHVHDKTLRMSRKDIENANVGSLNIIISGGSICVYRIGVSGKVKFCNEEPFNIIPRK